MAEAFSWMDGSLFMWTGAAAPSTSAVFAYTRDSRGNFMFGWDNRAAANRTYRDHLTGLRCDVYINSVYTNDTTITKIAESATAVHMKLLQSHAIGSAGYFLYSGRIDAIQYQGNEKNPFIYTLNVHFNSWSAF